MVGPGTTPAWMSGEDFGARNDAAIEKITSTRWMATTRRADTERPSRSRATC